LGKEIHKDVNKAKAGKEAGCCQKESLSSKDNYMEFFY